MTRRSNATEGAGFTLVELLVAMSLLAIIMAVIGPMYLSLQQGQQVTEALQSNDSTIRPVLTLLGNQVNSAIFVDNPAGEGSNAGTGIAPGFSMRMLTQAYGTLACVQWRVKGSALQERSWAPAWTSGDAAVNWRTEATGIVNASSDPPFTLEAATSNGAPAVSVDLSVSTGTIDTPVLHVETSLLVGNSASPRSTTCAAIPPWETTT